MEKPLIPRLIVEQKITAFTNLYAVYKSSAGGEKAELVAFAQQKRLAFKEKVTFFTNESKADTAFTFRAEKVMDVHGRYLVEDPAGKQIGSFKKVFKQSLLVSTWQVLDEKTGEPKFTIAENNVILAVLRRTVGFVPFVGDILALVIMLFKYHFKITDANGQLVGKYYKTTLFRDHYMLEMTDEAYAAEDWQVLAAQAVALDALQSR